MSEKLKWDGKTHGGYWGNWCFAKLLKIGLLPAYGLLVFVSAFFLAFRRRSCEGARKFLCRIRGKKVGAISADMYALIFSFGVCMLDRVSRFSGSGKISLDDRCGAKIAELVKGGRGLVVLTSHFGGWEMSGAELLHCGAKVGIVGMSADDTRIRNLIEKSAAVQKPEILGDTSDPLGMVNAYKFLKRGGVVAMHADRYAGGRCVEAEFLGGKVRAPLASYKLAELADAPVIQTFCVREKLFHYRTFAFEPINVSEIGAENAARKFISNLEKVAKKYPHQWFNFYDFWG